MTIINLSNDNKELEDNIKKYFKESSADTKNIRIYLIDDIDNLTKISSGKSKTNILITNNVTTNFILQAIERVTFLIYGGMSSEDIITKIEGCI